MKDAIPGSSGAVVTAFLKAMNEEDFNTARQYVHNDMQFLGVMGQRDGADAYFDDMEKMKFKYDIKRQFSDADDVAVFYDIDMQGKKIFCAGWYHVAEGKIRSFRVVFDPRPLLEEKK